MFRDEETSLSNAALIIVHEKGYQWSTIAGLDYWKYGGAFSELKEKNLEREE